MTKRADSLILWSPRVLAILACLYLGVFSLDAFTGKTFVQGLPDFAMHNIPMLILLAVVVISWHREWLGGLLFTALALGYAFMAPTHPSWILAISGPLLLVGILFFWSWFHRRGGMGAGLPPAKQA